jgi:hypothetical protein
VTESKADNSGDVAIYADAAVGKIEESPRPDGYRPISFPLLIWGRIVGNITGPPSQEEWRLFWSAARRLDTGHRQIERVREALDFASTSKGFNGQLMHDVIGDAEMGVWAIDKAIEIATTFSGLYRIELPFPRIVNEKQPLVAKLRDHYSHIDERSLGRVWRKPDASAEEAFEFEALVASRVLTDGHEFLSIDDEATKLCIATRDYIVYAWSDLVAREE